MGYDSDYGKPYKKKKKKKMTDTFNAKQAREITDGLHIEDLESWLVSIREAAKNGKSEVHVYKSISQLVLDELKLRGFTIYSHPSIAIQKEGLYYTIGW